MTRYTQLLGTGSAFPKRVMTNAEFEKFLDTSDEWIRTRTGIEKRHIADIKAGETTLSMASEACQKALQQAGVKAEEIDLIVVGTITSDMMMPTTGNFLQAVLGAKNAFSFDLQAACAGFLYALGVVDGFIKSGKIEKALVVGVDTLSTITDWRDRSTCVLFGDGAGAAVVGSSSTPGLIDLQLYSDGTKGKILEIPHGSGRVPPYSAEYKNSFRTIQMEGKEVFKLAVRNMGLASKKILEKNDLSVDQVDAFIFHQANLRIIETCAKKLGIPMERVWVNVQKYGNTSAATIPVSLDEARSTGFIKPGQLILMTSFGGGLAWGAGLWRV